MKLLIIILLSILFVLPSNSKMVRPKEVESFCEETKITIFRHEIYFCINNVLYFGVSKTYTFQLVDENGKPYKCSCTEHETTNNKLNEWR